MEIIKSASDEALFIICDKMRQYEKNTEETKINTSCSKAKT